MAAKSVVIQRLKSNSLVEECFELIKLDSVAKQKLDVRLKNLEDAIDNDRNGDVSKIIDDELEFMRRRIAVLEDQIELLTQAQRHSNGSIRTRIAYLKRIIDRIRNVEAVSEENSCPKASEDEPKFSEMPESNKQRPSEYSRLNPVIKKPCVSDFKLSETALSLLNGTSTIVTDFAIRNATKKVILPPKVEIQESNRFNGEKSTNSRLDECNSQPPIRPSLVHTAKDVLPGAFQVKNDNVTDKPKQHHPSSGGSKSSSGSLSGSFVADSPVNKFCMPNLQVSPLNFNKCDGDRSLIDITDSIPKFYNSTPSAPTAQADKKPSMPVLLTADIPKTARHT